MTVVESKRAINLFLIFILLLNFALWSGSRGWQARWGNVPPVPSQTGGTVMSLGDSQFAYRTGALILQNLGDNGGSRLTMQDYDYERLEDWFFFLNDLDPVSDYVPFMASYYYGATQEPENFRPLIRYLATIGQVPVAEKWRWLAQAVFMARHRLKDYDLALELAYLLANMQLIDGELPAWARQMPAFVLELQGENEAAREIISNLIKSGEGRWTPGELNFMKAFLVERLGADPKEVGPYE